MSTRHWTPQEIDVIMTIRNPSRAADHPLMVKNGRTRKAIEMKLYQVESGEVKGQVGGCSRICKKSKTCDSTCDKK